MTDTEWKPPLPKLGSTQEGVLKCLSRRHLDSSKPLGKWDCWTGWVWNGPLQTAKVLMSLSRKGLVDVIKPLNTNSPYGEGLGEYKLNEAGLKWIEDSVSPQTKATIAEVRRKTERFNRRSNLQMDKQSAFSKIAQLAIDAAHQKCSIDDVFAAVTEYENLVIELEDLKID